MAAKNLVTKRFEITYALERKDVNVRMQKLREKHAKRGEYKVSYTEGYKDITSFESVLNDDDPRKDGKIRSREEHAMLDQQFSRRHCLIHVKRECFATLIIERITIESLAA